MEEPYCTFQKNAQQTLCSTFLGLIGYHISYNQYKTTIFGPKIIRIGDLLAEIPHFTVWARCGQDCSLMGSLTPARDVDE